MKTIFLKLSFVLCLVSVLYTGCERELDIDLSGSGYPKEVGKLLLTKCAVSGCHNTASKDGAAGLDLSSWENLMAGDRNGAVCIPYATDYSTLLLFTNTYADLGVSVGPTMPIGKPPLTREEYLLLRDWVASGAPNAAGKVKFADNPNRPKYYITNQGCDVVAVFDAETGLQMRYVQVGAEATIESPHNVKVSPDGEYWYVAFSSGKYLERYKTSDNSFAGRILLGANEAQALGSWNTMAISPDGTTAFVVDWNFNGRTAVIDLANMNWMLTYSGSSLLVQPHGSAVSSNNNTLLLTCNLGNYLYKVDVTDPTSPSFDKIIIDGSSFPSNTSAQNAHEVIFTPDGSKVFATCQGTNDVRVLDWPSGTLSATLPVGVYPQEVAISTTRPYLFVTCTEDTATYPGRRGSVYIINYETNTVLGSVNTGFQPHGVCVDEARGLVLVAHRNIDSDGPAPHHSTSCSGRNGYVTFIDMNTLQLVPNSKIEVSVDPYSAVMRF